MRLAWLALFALLAQRTLSPCWAIELSPARAHYPHPVAATAHTEYQHETHRHELHERAARGHSHHSHAHDSGEAMGKATGEAAGQRHDQEHGRDGKKHDCGCCAGFDAQAVMLASSVLALAPPQANSTASSFAVAALPAPFEINLPFIGLYGREGPPGSNLQSQLCRSPLSGRAPPAAI